MEKERKRKISHLVSVPACFFEQGAIEVEIASAAARARKERACRAGGSSPGLFIQRVLRRAPAGVIIAESGRRPSGAAS